MEHLPPQEELRRRLRAARVLRDLTVTQLAERIPAEARLSVSTLRKIESGERELNHATLRELAARLGVAYAWFTVPDVGLAVGLGDRSFEDRLEALEAAQAAMWTSIREGTAARPGSIRHAPPSKEGD